MSRWIRAGQYILGILVFLGIWWGGSLIVGGAILPSPGEVVHYLSSPGVVGEFIRQTSLTAGRGILGFSLAWMLALPAGFLMGRREAGERIGFFPVFLLQSAPPLFWVTPLVLWLGTRGLVAPVVAFLVSLPLLIVHTAAAVRAIPEHEYDVFAIYAPRKDVIARELYLPHLLPALRSNVHLGVLVAVKASMLAEWFAAQDGFGRTIRLHYQFFAMTEFLSWALLFLVVVGGLSLLLKCCLDRFLPDLRLTVLPREKGAADSSAIRDSGIVGSEAVREIPAKADRALAAEGLAFGYGRGTLFENLSLKVSGEKPLVLSGESGCGKTTLLKCLAGLLPLRQGRITSESPVGLIFQDDALLHHRDALGNVLLSAFPAYHSSDIIRARQALQLWGLGDCENRFPHELSGGMCKRLAMAREWFRNSSVLLLDEPFVNLDREARTALWALLFERLDERGIPAIIVTHYPEEVAAYTVDITSWNDLTDGSSTA